MFHVEESDHLAKFSLAIIPLSLFRRRKLRLQFSKLAHHHLPDNQGWRRQVPCHVVPCSCATSCDLNISNYDDEGLSPNASNLPTVSETPIPIHCQYFLSHEGSTSLGSSKRSDAAQYFVGTQKHGKQQTSTNLSSTIY